MKIKTSELTGWKLAYAVAQHDPMCASLRWEKRDGVVFGVFDDASEDEGRLTCLFLGDLNVIERLRIHRKTSAEFYAPQELWQQGGPIIEREHITVGPHTHGPASVILGAWKGIILFDPDSGQHVYEEDGPTALVAAMRCFVASTLDDEVEIPEVLL